MWRNTSTSYGWLNKLLHWAVAVTVFGLFALGLWMTSLSYYDEWYHKGPDIHRSVGILLMLVMVLRVLLVHWMGKPRPLVSHSTAEVRLAQLVHLLIYLLVFAIGITGYLISTADGRGIEVFNWFAVPSLGSLFDHQEDVAGEVHEWLAYSLITLAVLHALAAVKHHVLDKDDTLKRML